MKCEYCDNEVPVGVTRCPSCGAAVSASPLLSASEILPRPSPSAETAQPQERQSTADAWQNPFLFVPKKSRVAYVLLAIFLGELGIHNFYAGYIGRGVVQLLITILSFGLLFWISWIWAIVELCVVSEDGKGVPFE